MLSTKSLTMKTISTLLIGTTLFAQAENCVNGVCFVTLDKPILKKTFEAKSKELIPLVQSVFMEGLDKTIDIVVDGDAVTVFSSYKMAQNESYLTEAEMENKILAEELVEKENQIDEVIIVQGSEKIENIILEKSDFKDSLYYCENETKPQFNEFTDLYQCV